MHSTSWHLVLAHHLLLLVTVVTDGPPVTITRMPSLIVASSAVGFSFTSTDTDDTITYECQLQGSSLTAQGFTACSSPQ